jgi:predicted transglutaminase-like protease
MNVNIILVTLLRSIAYLIQQMLPYCWYSQLIRIKSLLVLKRFSILTTTPVTIDIGSCTNIYILCLTVYPFWTINIVWFLSIPTYCCQSMLLRLNSKSYLSVVEVNCQFIIISYDWSFLGLLKFSGTLIDYYFIRSRRYRGLRLGIMINLTLITSC